MLWFFSDFISKYSLSYVKFLFAQKKKFFLPQTNGSDKICVETTIDKSD